MRKEFEKYLLLVFALLFVNCSSDDIDWSRTFDSDQTIPIGTLVLRQELKKIFPNSKITDITGNTFDYFDQNHFKLSDEHYFYINNSARDLPDETWQEILDFVNRGGSAFLSFYELSQALKKELGLETRADQYEIKDEKISLSVKKPEGEKTYIFDLQSKSNFYFSEFNTETTEILGYSTYDIRKEPNFVKVYYGKGYLLIHTEPVLFSNYEMLEKNHYQMVVDVFSYLDDADILWDNKRIRYRNHENQGYDNGGFFSSLSFIMKNKGLKYGFFTLMALGFLYLIFNSKRRQRVQEAVLPYPNYTLDFAKTLAELYRGSSDHTALVKYNINYFLEQLRQKYNISTKDTETDFSELLSSKSGVNPDICRKLVESIQSYRNQTYIGKPDFLKFQNLIASFNQNIKFNGRESGK